MSSNQENNFLAARSGVNYVYPVLEASIGAGKINNVAQMLRTASKQNSIDAFQPAFQELFNLAASQKNNKQVLRAIEPHVGAVLRGAGISEGAILTAKGSVQTAIKFITKNNPILDIILIVELVIVAIIVIVLLAYLFGKLLAWACTWMPNRKPTPMQTPDWSRLWGAAHSPAIGPAYTVEKRQKPSQIQLEA